jgi:hypothetical protein
VTKEREEIASDAAGKAGAAVSQDTVRQTDVQYAQGESKNMSEIQNSATTVTAGAGTTTTEAVAGAAVETKTETEKSCQTAGKEETKMDANANQADGNGTTAAVEAAAGAAAQASGGDGKTDKKKGCGSKEGENKKDKDKPVLILFSDLGVSQWNESYGTTLCKEHVKDLMEDIRRNKLMHPVTLTAGKNPDGPKFTILTGARRVEALKLLRGEDAGLRYGEFNIHDDLDENNPKCLDYSLAENTHRYGRSVIDRAVFIGRMLREGKVEQKKLAAKFNIRREVVNRLDKLANCLNLLPECWRKDLEFSPKSGGKEPKKTELPKITISHWVEVAGKIDDGDIGPVLLETMKKAHKKGWSTSRLRRELSGKGAAANGGAAAKDVNLVKMSLSKLSARLQGKDVGGDEELNSLLAAIGKFTGRAGAKGSTAMKDADTTVTGGAETETSAGAGQKAEAAPVQAGGVRQRGLSSESRFWKAADRRTQETGQDLSYSERRRSRHVSSGSQEQPTQRDPGDGEKRYRASVERRQTAVADLVEF